ncbi:unnamed protein product [Peniophora sp. CBMAI 1063]|nr:unnamed protein product [Peniophora sp. CBMAI 1063]
MARFSLLCTLLAAAAAPAVMASPLDGQVAMSPQGDVRISESWSYSDCGSPSDAVQIESIVVSPDPPKPGEDMTVTVKGTAVETIKEGAYADVTVKLGLIKLLQKEFDICEEARNANASITCPVEEGYYTVVQTVTLPKEIPQAKFTVAVKGYTVDDDDLFCLNLKVDFMKRFLSGLW